MQCQNKKIEEKWTGTLKIQNQPNVICGPSLILPKIVKCKNTFIKIRGKF